MAGRDLRESFHDMEAINDYLQKSDATAEVFKLLVEKDPKLAKQVFDLAQPSLVEGKAYKLLGKFLSPNDDFAKMRQRYREGKKLAEGRFGARHLDFAKKKLVNDASTLVAILIINERKPEAIEVAALAQAELDDKSFRAEIDKALEGVVPKPWP